MQQSSSLPDQRYPAGTEQQQAAIGGSASQHARTMPDPTTASSSRAPRSSPPIPAVGDFDEGDVVIRGERIEAVGADLAAAAGDGQAIVIEMGGMIAELVLPAMAVPGRHAVPTPLGIRADQWVRRGGEFMIRIGNATKPKN